MTQIPKGLCQCGCGRLTTIANKSDSRYGHVSSVTASNAQIQVRDGQASIVYPPFSEVA